MSDRDSKGRYKKGSRPNNFKHGMDGTRLYTMWLNMKSRCHNKKGAYYPDYGGRGIAICEGWLEFIPFMEWALANGYSDKLTIDRTDNDGNYSPDNCSFITNAEQSRNHRLIRRDNTSGYCGVIKTSHGNYGARVGNYLLGKKVWLGTFKSPIAAALVRDTYVLDNNLGLPLNFTYVDSL